MSKTHGGSRKGAGRPQGALNKVTREVREIAADYGPAAIEELARLSVKAESELTRIAACKEILDRAYGKPAQAVQVTRADPSDEITDEQRLRLLTFFLAKAQARQRTPSAERICTFRSDES